MVSGFLAGIGGGATVAIVIKAIDNYSKEFQKATTGMERFTKVAKIVGVAATAAFTAFTISAAKAGLQMIPIEQSFKRLAKSSEKFLVDLNEATKGTISNFELMTNANKALLLGLDQEALPKLFENAAIVGRAAGRTTTEAISDITLGIGRQSRMILDNLGIIIKATDVYDNYAVTIGKVTSELTAQERQTAFNEAAMKALQESADNLGGIIPEDAITDIQRLTKGFEDFRREFGKAFIENFSIVLPKAENDWKSFGMVVGQVVGLIGSSVILTVKVLELVIRTLALTVTTILGVVATGIDIFVNQFIRGINIIIQGLNFVRQLMGKDPIEQLKPLNLGTGFFESAIKQFEKAEELSKDIGRIGEEMFGAFKNVGNVQEDNLAGINAQINATKELSEEQELVNKLQGFKVLSSGPKGNQIFGDIFNPRAFKRSDFESDFAYGQAKSGGGITINIENINGLDPEEISRALANELNSKVSL